MSLEELIESVKDQDCLMENGPSRLDLRMGNLCNLKCRMCSAESSSSIQSDKVQSKWPFPLDDFPKPAKWRNLKSIIAPQKVLGVNYKNLPKIDLHADKEVSWISNKVTLCADIRNIEFSGFSIQLINKNQKKLSFRIFVNGKIVCHDWLEGDEWSCIFSAKELDLKLNYLEISIEPDLDELSFSGPLGIAEIALLREKHKSNSISISRFNSSQQWYYNTDFIQNDLLYDIGSIYHIGIIGGEPLLISEVSDFMEYLISQNVSKNITLSFSTNATVINERWVELAQKFAAITVAVSVDGIGELNDYIRYPSNWIDIEKNVKFLQRMENAYVYVNTSVSPYNILDITKIIDFCEDANLDFLYHPIDEPTQLKVSNMPYAIRQIASDRLRRYGMQNSEQGPRTRGHVNNRSQAIKLADALVHQISKSELAEEIREFMIYTNDLDQSRSQRFSAVGSELIMLLDKSGYHWISDLRHAQDITRS
jgi:glutamate-1-semialdehyde 2,1-aminomutase